MPAADWVDMAYDPGESIPETFEELDAIAARCYSQGVDAGKAKLRADIRDFLKKEFRIIRGNERRANQEDPRYLALTSLMEKLYAAFEDGTL
jgi:hypothetical protein